VYNGNVMDDDKHIKQDVSKVVEEINLNKLLVLILQAKWSILFFCLFSCLVATAYYFLDSPKYNSSFSVYYKQITDNNNLEAYKYAHSDKLDNDYWVKIMKSQNFIDRVRDLSSVNLTGDEFTLSQKKGNDNIFNVSLVLDSKENLEPVIYSYIDALNNLEKENNNKRLSSFLNYIKEQLRENTAKLKEVNRLIPKYSVSLKLGQIDDRGKLKATFDDYKKKLNDLNISLATINAEKLSTQKEYDELKDTIFYRSSFSEPLKVQLVNLNIDLAKAQTRYKDAHPTVLCIKENIKQVELMLAKGIKQNIEVKNLTANPLKRDLYSSFTKILIKEQAIKSEINATREILQSLSQQLNNNSGSENVSDLLLKREQYYSAIEILNKRIIDTENFLKSEMTNFILVNSPDIPIKKSNKSLAFLILVALFLSLSFGCFVVIAIGFIDNRLCLISDIEDNFRVPILGVLVHRKKNNTLKSICTLALKDLNELFYRELSQVKINVNQLVRSDKKIYSIISPSRKEGKTMFSYLFSHELARSGAKVLLIDLDTYVPRLSKCLGLDDKIGLQDYLLNENIKLEDCVNKTVDDNLDVLACGLNEFENQIFYDNIRFDSLLEEASAVYDKIIIDTPGMLFFPEIVGFVRRVDYAIVVARMNKTTCSSLKELLKKINKLSVQILGIVVTDRKKSILTNDYNYDYNYGKE